MLSIRRVEPLDGYWIRLTLSDGSKVERNVRDLLRGPVFEPIHADYAKFHRVRVQGGTIVWPGDLDLDQDVLIWNGPAPTHANVRPAPRAVLHHPSVEAHS